MTTNLEAQGGSPGAIFVVFLVPGEDFVTHSPFNIRHLIFKSVFNGGEGCTESSVLPPLYRSPIFKQVCASVFISVGFIYSLQTAQRTFTLWGSAEVP